MKTIAKWLGGSHAYKLNTSTSDIDERGVFMSEEHDVILGLKKFNQETITNKTKDSQMLEVRYLMELLKNGKMNAIEGLWLEPADYIETTPEFLEIRSRRKRLLDTEQLYNSLRGFLKSQKGKVFGPVEGNKEEDSLRRTAIEQYGFYPKPAYHTLRLAETGVHYFFTGNYRVAPVNCHATCLRLKTNPETFSLSEVQDLVNEAEASLERTYQNRIANHIFDYELANDLLLFLYSDSLFSALKNKVRL
jgi:predicted nucleotidyltransferase